MKLGGWIRVQWDRCLALAAVVFGVVALLVGWHGVANETLPAGQIPYVVSGGVGGLFALGIGATLWIAAELRDQWHKLDRIERQLRASGPSSDEEHDVEPALDVRPPVDRNGRGGRSAAGKVPR